MQTPDTPSYETLLQKNRQLRFRIEELEKTLHAIRYGEVDALVVPGPAGLQVYTQKNALEPYRVMIEVLSEGAIKLAQDGAILYCNARFAELVKTPHEQIIGLPLYNWVAAQDRGKLDLMLAQVWQGVTRDELTLQAGDGSQLPAFFSLCPLPESAGKDIAAVVTDLTEVTATAAAISKLALIVETSNDAIISASLDGTVESWNKAAERLFGYTAAEAIGQSIQHLIVPPDCAGEITDRLATIRRGEYMKNIETVRLHKDGTPVDVAVTASPLNNAMGRAVGMSIILRDITESKRAVESINISQARFSTIFNQAPLGIALIDSFTGKIHEVNPRFAQIAGRTVEEMKCIDWMAITHPDDVQKDLDNMALLNAGKITGFRMDKRYRRPDGSFVWINMTIAPLRMEPSISPRHLCMIDDITERKQMEEEVRRLNAKLEQRVMERTDQLETANKELESFAYSVSHDLRVPLRAIDGFSHLVLKRYEEQLDDEGRRLLNVVRDNTKRMGQLIDDILAFSRMGRLELRTSEVDMAATAREVWRELEPSMAGRDVRMDIGPLPKAPGDPAMLRQIWVNLLTNAAKFTRPKPAAHIEVEGKIEGTECVYSVKDNGAGFDMQYADKLFVVFQRLHGVEEFEGTGIGLAIVKRIVTRHGGRVWAAGKVNEGAVFYFALPLI